MESTTRRQALERLTKAGLRLGTAEALLEVLTQAVVSGLAESQGGLGVTLLIDAPGGLCRELQLAIGKDDIRIVDYLERPSTGSRPSSLPGRDVSGPARLLGEHFSAAVQEAVDDHLSSGRPVHGLVGDVLVEVRPLKQA